MSSALSDKELLDKIELGIKLAIKKLYEEKARNDESVVICREGKIVHMSARKLLEERALKSGHE
jgi:hypothetical protein